MKMFYFVGGPKEGQSEAFFRCLAEIGGTPAGWQIYAHDAADGKALHIVRAESEEEILAHLQKFGEIYEWSEIVPIVER